MSERHIRLVARLAEQDPATNHDVPFCRFCFRTLSDGPKHMQDHKIDCVWLEAYGLAKG